MNTSKINILSESLTNKIAAGEVIERPASVVKELVENALDAGSTHLTIVLKDGGRSLIQIIDNGSGMSREDAILCFQRHTTSKISNEDDLFNIKTLGFRGEALASIASICRMEIKTAEPGAAEGTLLKLEGGVLTSVDSTAVIPGTAIAVKNLFYNTPARRKFMRADKTEYRHILNILNRFTLAFNNVSFTLVNEGEIIYDLKSTGTEARLIDVLGSKCTGQLIPVTDEGSLLKITGFVGKWDLFRKSRGEQYLFLNQRYIVNRALHHAILSAYGAAITGQQYPLYVLYLNIDPAHVDVNVHPTKIEAKFSDERLVYSLVRGAVSRAVTSNQIIPEMTSSAASRHPSIDSNMPVQSAFNLSHASPVEPTAPGKSGVSPFRFSGSPSQRPISGTSPLHPAQAIPATSAATEQESSVESRQIWQLHNRYLLISSETGLTIIDQHVAHERILFERAMRNFENETQSSQQLLFPQVIDLSPEDRSYLQEILPFLEKIGYIIKEFSGHTITIEGVPSGLKSSNNELTLQGIIDEYKKNRGDNPDIRENVAKSFSCKMAIKAGEKLSQAEMQSLVRQLYATQTPYFCPHGRPVIVNISLEEFDRRFGRI
ncbi:DNA mismatch repair endonuclease MutL [candidate division KSB1 bacterium]|nr:DNA mismatch repair endonuclease MutL [candidate division KSB1 bacterium]